VFRINLTPGASGLVPPEQVSVLREAGRLTSPPPIDHAAVMRTTPTTATIHWDAPSTLPAGYRFRIYQSTNSDNGFTQIAEKFRYENAHTGFRVEGLDPGQTYYFRISVRDFADNVSAHSTALRCPAEP
jgi:fibronectin type III domain protein